MTTAADILDRCDELARHSSLPNGLIERVYLSPEHAAVNALAAEWMTAAGLATWQDAAGNQCGRLEGATPGLPALLLGSHLDTVPAAGRYDGILGVLLAIAVAERLAQSGRPLPFALEVAAFGDEEGTRFGTTLLGSRALAGTWQNEWWGRLDANGVSLDAAYRAFGLDPALIGEAARTPVELIGYLEAHIEQGAVLDDAGLALGVVSSIAGARRFQVVIEGAARHSGTPWALRRDALAGASEVILAIERIAREADLIGTVGHLALFPDAVNVIPGRVEFSLDLRGEFDPQRDRAWALIEQTAEQICERRGLTLTSVQTHGAPAAHCSPHLRAAVATGIRLAGGESSPTTLFSMAGHDAMAIAALTDIGMLFVRCLGGVSHHPDESVTEADVAVALDAFEAAVLALADQYDADEMDSEYDARAALR
ncbi:allantoate deiminase [Cryobacterium flavum]|uniref:Allantoate amidohydrolase n=1 Tax=Cryobacterium flavum TaxID=1424659 RepID=A0A4V3I865_9MICO|nr:allantoate amidohydrolase [Cryobacterium flavum]TFB73057.1 allantoate amidohydrolase [Cryobacterium flavum]SDN01631.1 allantoate deiminase [Cryobacterium flavum]